jgi:hypothetical protein
MKKIFFQKNKSGMTLAETLVAITIFTIGITGFTELFVQTWKSNSFIIEKGQIITLATQVLRGMEGRLRSLRQGSNGDYAVKSGNDFDLVVYLDDNNDSKVERVHFYLDKLNDKLQKGVTNPGEDGSYPSGDQSIITLASYVTNTDSQPIFYYYGKNYPPASLSTPVIPTDVRLIEVSLWVNIKPLTAPDNINIQSVTQLRNVGENQ